VSRQFARRVLVATAWAVLLVLVVTIDAAAATYDVSRRCMAREFAPPSQNAIFRYEEESLDVLA
jgi:hypothetical protein